jgi:hypothetical protein
MAIDATSAHRRPGADSDLSTQRRRRRPRWWMVLLAAVAAVVVATVVVIQLLPNAADGPPVVGATQVAGPVADSGVTRQAEPRRM